MADFRKAFLKTGGNEGGYQNNPADKGNTPGIGTYKGIAFRPNPNWRGWSIIRAELGCLTPQPEYGTPAYRGWVKAIDRRLEDNGTLQRYVIEFFKAGYWDKYRLDEVESQPVADWLYDHAVNGGARGVMWMQEALGVTADGGVGPITLKAINSADPVALLRKSRDVSAFYRLDRALNDPSQVQFLPSWLRRDGVPEEDIKEVMAAAKDGLSYTEVAELKSHLMAA